jgi:transcriptional regulator with XRE-family HTH domain
MGTTACTSPNSKVSITREQIRATRGLIKWSREKLSVVSGVPIRTLARIETGEVEPRAETLKAIRTTFEKAGVKFRTGPRDTNTKPSVG